MKKMSIKKVLIVGHDDQLAIRALKKIAEEKPVILIKPTLCACCGVNPVNLLDGDSTICGDCTGKM